MRIIDEQDKEIAEDEIDLKIGHLIQDYIQVEFHEATECLPEEGHNELVKVVFDDGTEYVPVDNDGHVDDNGDFVPGDEYTDKFIKDIEYRYVIDREYVPGEPEWYENEEVLRYVLYTDEEIAQIEANEKIIAEREAVEIEKQEQYQSLLDAVDDITLILAELIGGVE